MIGAIRRETLGRFFAMPMGEVEAGVPTIATRGMYRNFMNQKKGLESWLTDKQFKTLEKYVMASTQAASAGRMENPASGRQLLAYAQITSSLMSAGSFAAGQPAAGATLAIPVVLPYVAAKAMMNPTISRLIAEGLSLSKGQIGALRWGPRFANAMRIWTEAGMPEEEKE